MSGNDFPWLATAFFIAYAVAEVPQGKHLTFGGLLLLTTVGTLLQKFPVTKVLGVNVFLWGVFLCCSSAAQNYAGILAVRILLGCVEAVIGMINFGSPSEQMLTSSSSSPYHVYQHVVHKSRVHAAVRFLVLWSRCWSDCWRNHFIRSPARASFSLVWGLADHVRRDWRN